MRIRSYCFVVVGLLATIGLSACGGDTADGSNIATERDTGAGDSSAPDATNVTPNNDPDAGDTGPTNVDPGDMSPDVATDMDGPDADPTLCGNGMLDPGEDCDDANGDETDGCNSMCGFTCGDGVVGVGELCDIAIADGMMGACPTACDDGDACTTDTLQGTACQATCVTGAITACADADGCCPMMCAGTTDSDCMAMCGNGVIEGGETCDGNCPTMCDDGIACTTDAMAGDPSTCDVVCSATDITMCIDGDGCCPPGCDASNDDDCSDTCGNGTVEPPESCDGNCPMDGTDCDDMDACTADTVSGSAAQCTAMCVNTPLGCAPNFNDNCCPAQCNANNDADCTAVCGNLVQEMGEGCDDGNTVAGDGCDDMCQPEVGPVAFRMSDLDIMDPHIWVNAFGCRDMTNSIANVNGLLQDELQGDADNDGILDLSFVAIFDPLDQSNGATGPLTVAEADCTAPQAGTSCTVDSGGGTFQQTTHTVDTMMDCLTPLPGTTFGYMPPVASSGAPCFYSDTIDLAIDIGGIVISLSDVQVGGTFVGNPATQVSDGLLMGFISEADADATILPGSLPLVGGDPLSSVLAGGTGSCANHDDRDLGPDGITMGWWFYLNFPADAVPFTVQ